MTPDETNNVPVTETPVEAAPEVVEEVAAPVGEASIVDMEATPAAEQFPLHDNSPETSQ